MPPMASGRMTRKNSVQRAAAVDARRLLDLYRDVVEETLHHPHHEGQVDHHVDHDQPDVGAGQATERMTQKMGMAVTMGGIMRVESTHRLRSLLPRKR